MKEELDNLSLEEMQNIMGEVSGMTVTQEMLNSAKRKLEEDYETYTSIKRLIEKFGNKVVITTIEQCLKIMREDI